MTVHTLLAIVNRLHLHQLRWPGRGFVRVVVMAVAGPWPWPWLYPNMLCYTYPLKNAKALLALNIFYSTR